jgi:serine/threonine protein kinase
MNYFTMILFALDFLHSKEILHLNLKPSNIFISSLKDGSNIIKIGDFDFLKVDFKQSDSCTTKSTFSFPTHTAPEILLN